MTRLFPLAVMMLLCISCIKSKASTGTWLEVKGLALLEQLIEIDMESHITK